MSNVWGATPACRATAVPPVAPTVAKVPKYPNSPGNFRQQPRNKPPVLYKGQWWADVNSIKWHRFNPTGGMDTPVEGMVPIIYHEHDFNVENACVYTGGSVTVHCPFFGERTPATGDPIRKTVRRWVEPYAPGATDLWKVYETTTLTRTHNEDGSGSTSTRTSRHYVVVEGSRPGGAGSEQDAEVVDKPVTGSDTVYMTGVDDKDPPPPNYNPHRYKPGDVVPNPATYKGGMDCLTSCRESELLWNLQWTEYRASNPNLP